MRLVSKLSETRKKRIQYARERTSKKRQGQLRPMASSWHEIDKLYQQWTEHCTDTTENISICSSCGVCSFERTKGKQLQLDDKHVKFACATLVHTADKNNIVTNWTHCSSCKKTKRTRNVVILQPDYIHGILNSNQIHVQLLSIIDISISVATTANAVARGVLDRRSLLDNPLVCWSTNSLHSSIHLSSSPLKEILAHNINNNPIIQKYKTMAEHSKNSASMCILSSETVTNIMKTYSANDPFELMQQADALCDIAILDNMYNTSKRTAYNTDDTHEFGSIQLRDSSRIVERTIAFRYNGIPSNDSEVKDITIESAMFPFLFPMGKGYYQGEMRFGDYLRMRINSMFSIYTLYKPYLLMMYQLKQAIMIANS